MVALSREQLGGLLRLEETYATRDYLEDLTVQTEHRDFSSWQIRNIESSFNDNSTTSQDQQVASLDQQSFVGSEIPCKEVIQSDASLPSTAASTAITVQRVVSWREKICEWSYQVADHFDLTRDLVYIAMNYLDRVCAASDSTEFLQDKSRFQLLAMSTLCLAIKLHGGMDIHAHGVESSIVETILHLGRGRFSAEELKAMEVITLQHLQWRLNPPTPQTFVSHFLELFPVEEKAEINDIAQYIIELSVHDYFLTPSKPSVLALAALSNAAHMLGHSDEWMNKIVQDILERDGYEGSTSIDACKDRLGKLYANTGTKLEDFVDVSSLRNTNHLDGVCRERSPTSVIT